VGTAGAFSVPTTMTYQGRLTDNSPQQVPVDGTVEMTFSIWDADTGGSLLWSEPQFGTVTVYPVKGVFNVLLGSYGVPLPPSVFAGGAVRYLEITVGGETLAPRQRIGTVGFAAQAERSADTDKLSGQVPANWQMRVTGSCAAGTAMASINANGTVTCNSTQGALGQSGSTVYSNGGLLQGSYTLIQGLTRTVNVPANSLVLIATSGAANSPNGGGNVSCGADVAIYIDGVIETYKTATIPGNNNGSGTFAAWAMTIVKTLTAGNHTIETRARDSGGGIGCQGTVNIGGSGQARSELTVVVVKL
jgi:hypothetical protein